MTFVVFGNLALFSFIHVATKGWDRRKVVIKRADKRLGQDEKIQIIYFRI